MVVMAVVGERITLKIRWQRRTVNCDEAKVRRKEATWGGVLIPGLLIGPLCGCVADPPDM